MAKGVERHLHEIVALSLGSAPDQMLEKALSACIELAGAESGSILAEEGPYLQFMFSAVEELIGKQVPHDSIAGNTVSNNVVIYTYAPIDNLHLSGVDAETRHETKYLLSIPIPSVLQGSEHAQAGSSGALQLLFEEDIVPGTGVVYGAIEFGVGEFRGGELCA